MDKVNQEKFLKIIDATPLVSIDLIIENPCGEILLGKRLNRPAQNFWFVPGGRIKKNEKIADAMLRISLAELGHSIAIKNTSLLGAYNHIYHDNAFDEAEINTHYVVLAYKIKQFSKKDLIVDAQHSALKYWPVEELLAADNVHENTKAYFIDH